MDKGLLHVYCGDGKGKTTAAMGLALRALGNGKQVCVVQFLKSGTSGELAPLQTLGAQVISGGGCGKFSFQMNDREREETRFMHNQYLQKAAECHADLLILDEACAALSTGLIDEELLKKTVLGRPEGQELVITGRNPSQWMLDAADYITEMECRRHPYEKGIGARRGVEY